MLYFAKKAAMLNHPMGPVAKAPDGSDVQPVETEVYQQGQPITRPLEDSFLQRLADGEELANSLVEVRAEEGEELPELDEDVEPAAESDPNPVSDEERQQFDDDLKTLAEASAQLETDRQQLDADRAQLEREKADHQAEVERQAADAEAQAPTAEDEGQPAEAFDPNGHSVEEVKAYLTTADDDERVRVLIAEEAGQARVTILRFEPPVSQADAGDSGQEASSDAS